MESVVNAISNILDKLKIKEVIFAAGIICGIILFAPIKYLKILGLEKFQSEYRSCLGIAFLFCCLFCFIWIIKYIKNRFDSDERFLKKATREYLRKNISQEEQGYLIYSFYDFSRGEFKLSATLNIMNGLVTPLEHAGIIYRSSSVAYSYEEWQYNLQPYAMKLLNEAVRNKRVEIMKTMESFTWRWNF